MVMTNVPGAPGAQQPDSIQYEATATAYYQSVVGRASAARSRAAAGFAIVSAISGAVVAGAFTAQIDHARLVTRWLALFGVAFWLLSAGLFMLASIIQPRSIQPNDEERKRSNDIRQATLGVATGGEGSGQDLEPGVATGGEGSGEELEPDVFVDYVPRVAKEEAHLVNIPVALAGIFAGIALLLTISIVVSVVFFPKGPERIPERVTADVTVKKPYFRAFLAECHLAVTEKNFHDLVGTLDVSSLNSHFLALDLDPGICADQGQLEIPRADVLQVEEYPRCSSSDMSRAGGTLALLGTRIMPASTSAKFSRDTRASVAQRPRLVAPSSSAVSTSGQDPKV
jgi:hypothetical protein